MAISVPTKLHAKTNTPVVQYGTARRMVDSKSLEGEYRAETLDVDAPIGHKASTVDTTYL